MSDLSDLEQLLEDLGRPKSVAPSKKTRSSVVNLNELEALIGDLADSPTPATRTAPTPAPAPTKPTPVAAKPARAAVSTSFEADDLDSIMDALNAPTGNNHYHEPEEDDYHYQAPAPVVHAPPPKAAPQPSYRDSVQSNTTIDELEDLLNGLEDNSRASVRANNNSRLSVSRPAATPAAPSASVNGSYNSGNSRLNVAARPAAAPTPSYNSHAAAPAPSYNAHAAAPTPSYNSHAAPAQNNNYGGNNYNSNNSRLSVAAAPATRPSPAYQAPAYQAPAHQAPAANQKPFVANPSARNNSTALDALLGDLQQQLLATPDPSSPSTNGTCAGCGRVILGEVITASGNRYHPEHFVCGNCREPLGTSNFYEQDGVHHCEKCYQELLCPRCGHCDEPILDRCVTAMGKKWHIDHFICTQCLHPFKNGSFFERDGRAFCETCFASAFAPRCGGCSQPINGPCINAVGQSWHPEHFVCQYCQKAFNGVFYEFGGKPYCDLHYHQQTGSLCAGCSKAIAGKCVDALGKKWHPEHFVCAFCMNPLAAGSFTENNSKAYCKDCHGKLFG